MSNILFNDIAFSIIDTCEYERSNLDSKYLFHKNLKRINCQIASRLITNNYLKTIEKFSELYIMFKHLDEIDDRILHQFIIQMLK